MESINTVEFELGNSRYQTLHLYQQINFNNNLKCQPSSSKTQLAQTPLETTVWPQSSTTQSQLRLSSLHQPSTSQLKFAQARSSLPKLWTKKSRTFTSVAFLNKTFPDIKCLFFYILLLHQAF